MMQLHGVSSSETHTHTHTHTHTLKDALNSAACV